MLRLVRTTIEHVSPQGFRPTKGDIGSEDQKRRKAAFSLLHDDVLSLRPIAAFSRFPDVRLAAAHALCDVDSFIFVIERSEHEDSRQIAKKGLEHRLCSFTDDALRHLEQSPSSEILRAAGMALEKRK